MESVETIYYRRFINFPAETGAAVLHQEAQDWALTELDEKKFLHSPENKVLVGSRTTDASENVLKETIPVCIRDQQLDNGLLPFKLMKLDDEDMKTSFRVGERGSATNLTFGVRSAIKTVAQQPGYGVGDFYY